MIIETIIDDVHGHIADIEKLMMRPYKDAGKQTAYRIMCYDYEIYGKAQVRTLYHASVYETFEEAMDELKRLCFPVSTTDEASMAETGRRL